MKKFLVLFHDEWVPKQEIMDAWQAWFASIGERFVDSGTPLSGGIEITRAGTRELSSTDAMATGYSIISAADRADAEALLAGCPYASSVRLYESMAM